jgi:ABC-type bacteriocin/lantibiotic exporter with double-glycine peptidase domain
VVCWSLIALSAVAFLVAMWLPSHPLWLLIVVAVAFAIGILSLFFVSRDPSSNPRLDDNGTAV